jgi:hypothetical protein
MAPGICIDVLEANDQVLLNKSENPFALSFFCVCFRVSGSSF